MQARLAEIEKERMISPMPPVVSGGALIVPMGLLRKLMGTAEPAVFGQQERRVIENAAMTAVMRIEADLSYQPKDVCMEKRGFDIESSVPEELRAENGGHALRFIEVKGRAKGATTVTVSKNEILCALTAPEQFILAIVEVDGKQTHTIYLRNPFKTAPDFSATSVNYCIKDLVSESDVIVQEKG